MTPLTNRQERIMAALRDHFARHPWGPTRREIAKAAGVGFGQTLSDELEALQAAGLIRKMTGRAAALELVSPAARRGRLIGDNLRLPASTPDFGALFAPRQTQEAP